jgi:hypothetical protein
MRETIVTPKSAATAYVSAFFVGEECPAVRLGMVTDLTFDDKNNPEFDIAIGNYEGHWQLAQRAGKHNLRAPLPLCCAYDQGMARGWFDETIGGNVAYDTYNLRETSIQTPEETRRILALGGLVVAHFLDNPQQTLLTHLSSRQAVAMQSFNTAQLQALEQTHHTQLIPGSATLPQ